MSLLFSRPVRNRVELTPDEHRAAAGCLLAQFRLACAMVVLNLMVPFSRETFRGHFLPAIMVFALACLVSLTRRLLGPRSVKRDEVFSALTIVACLALWAYGRDVFFSQRLLGAWQVPNVLAGFTPLNMIGLVIAALLIPHDDCWKPLHVAAFLAGACLIGVGMPGEELGPHEFYAMYLGWIAILCLTFVALDIARCFRAFCSCSPLTDAEGARRILGMSPADRWFLSPFLFFADGDRLVASTWKAQVLWFSMWPTPPESLDPRNLSLAHSWLFRLPGVRRFFAAMSYASIFAFALVNYPPGAFPRPYLVFAVELLSPPLVLFAFLMIFNGPFLLRADSLSRQFQKGNP